MSGDMRRAMRESRYEAKMDDRRRERNLKVGSSSVVGAGLGRSSHFDAGVGSSSGAPTGLGGQSHSVHVQS